MPLESFIGLGIFTVFAKIVPKSQQTDYLWMLMGLAARFALQRLIGAYWAFRWVLGAASFGLGSLLRLLPALGRGMLMLLHPTVLIRAAFAALRVALIASGVGLLLAGVAMAGLWIWQNWQGLATFFRAFGAAFVEALGPAAPLVDALVQRVRGLWTWVLAITGPVDESGETWLRWGHSVGHAIGTVVRRVSEFLRAHPGLVRTLGYFIAALGAIRLLTMPVAAGLGFFTSAASALGTVVGIAARAVIWLGRAFLIAGRLMLANPVVAVIATIAGAAYLIYRNWADVGPWFGRLWDGVRNIFGGFSDFVTGIFTGDLGAAWEGIKRIWDGVTGYYQTLWDGVSGIFTAAWTNYIAPVLDKLGLLDPVKAAWQGLQDALGRSWTGSAPSSKR